MLPHYVTSTKVGDFTLIGFQEYPKCREQLLAYFITFYDCIHCFF